MMGLTKWYHLRRGCTVSFHVQEQLLWTMGEMPNTLRRDRKVYEDGKKVFKQ